MPSNVENILNAILTGDGSGIQKPASRVEELLFEIYEQGGGGGDSVIGGIKLTIDSNYVMTATLVDKDGEEYGVSDDIDLPLEEMVVDAEYDPQTQTIKLELKNGNYVEFSVAELVSGLQTELSSSNKLNPAYIDYDASHRAVSDTEKNTWNAKQNAISDLETIRSGAAAGATAVQPSALETALSTKQDTISDLAAIRSGASAGATAVQPATMSTALALKQDSLSEAQLAAVNSGIDSTKVEQISTNQTNILYVANKTGKNLLKLDNFDNPLGITYTVNADNSITINKPAAVTDNEWRAIGTITLKAGTYVLSGVGVTGLDPSSFKLSDDHDWDQWNDTYTQAVKTITEETTITIYINIFATTTLNNVTIYPMVCTLEDWNIGHDYTLYALPNYDLTYREQQDRNALVEQVDEGAKNALDLSKAETITKPTTLTYSTNSDGSITVTATNANAGDALYFENVQIPNGTYIASGCPAGGSDDTIQVQIYSENTPLAKDYGDGSGQFSVNNGLIGYRIRFGTGTRTVTIKPMICTKAKWDISHEYEPHALPNTDLTVLEADDRAALAEVVDSGAKNIVDISKAYASDYGNVSIDTNTNSVTVSGTHAWAKGNIAVSVKPNTTYAIKYRISANTSTVQSSLTVTKGDTSDTYYSHIIASGTIGSFTGEFTTDANASIAVVKITANSTGSEIATAASITISELMICTLADWKVSQKYVPFTLKPPRIIYKSATTDVDTTEAIISDLTFSIPANYMARVSINETYDNVPPSKLRLAQDTSMTSTENYKEPNNSGDGISMVAVYRAGYPKTIYVSTAAIGSGKNTIDMLIELFEV